MRQKAFFIIFKILSGIRNCLRSGSWSLKECEQIGIVGKPRSSEYDNENYFGKKIKLKFKIIVLNQR